MTATPARLAPAIRLPGWGVGALWLATRLLLVAVWGLLEHEPTGDVFYYHRRISELMSPDAGLASTLIEYPTPVVWILSLPWLAGGGARAVYVGLFVVAMLALDVWLTVLLHRQGTSSVAVLFWIVFVPLLGPLALLRFDMIPAVLAGVALLGAARRSTVAGGLVGLGAAIKLWPALLLPALLGGPQRRRPAVLGFVGVGFGLALVSLLVGGWTRLVSPLTWQSDRGLQVESVWATPVMLTRMTDPQTHPIAMSRYQAFEVFGPGVGFWTSVADVATVVGLLLVLLLFVRVWRSASTDTALAAVTMTAVVGVMIVTNKTLSPQYLLWLGGPLAVLLLSSGTASVTRTARLLAVGALALVALTHVVYPVMYGDVVYGSPGPRQTVALAVLALRNVGLLVLTGLAVGAAWRWSRPSTQARSTQPR